jgi:hypothetical protein
MLTLIVVSFQSLVVLMTIISAGDFMEIDVAALNNFVHIGTGLMLAGLAWTVGKYVYRLFRLFI